ncbi:MAG: OadG family protein [Marinilabiliaceae bacterium]|nr:OadG family protein [Marinilabiliaceae bacterium]
MKRVLHLKANGLIILLVLFGSVIFQNSHAQGAVDLKLNEILLYNDSGYVDEYGQRGTWIEIFNSGYSTVDIGGMYFSNDPNNPKKYKVAKDNVSTIIPPRNYYVVWADGNSLKGINHLNFTLAEKEFLFLYDANGRSLIDSIQIEEGIGKDKAFGRLTDGFDDWRVLERPSPLSSNQIKEEPSGAEKFGKVDPTGAGMMVIAMGVVFSALALLFFIFKYMGKVLNKEKTKTTKKDNVDVKDMVEDEMSGEVNAAIALALYLYKDQMHDYENTVLTINKVSRTYSPWSSKIYGLRQTPR